MAGRSGVAPGRTVRLAMSIASVLFRSHLGFNLALWRKQFPDVDAQGIGDILQPFDAGRVYPAFDHADEINGVPGAFRQRFLRQTSVSSEHGDSLAEI